MSILLLRYFLSIVVLKESAAVVIGVSSIFVYIFLDILFVVELKPKIFNFIFVKNHQWCALCLTCFVVYVLVLF